MSMHSFLGFDLGAESGRAMLGVLRDNTLQLHEIHRFPNAPVRIHGHLYWDVYSLFEELKTGLARSLDGDLPMPESLGIDTWGVDFGFLGEDGTILGLPHAYRDPQTDGMIDELVRILPRERIYALTGIQFLQFNSLVQLLAMRRRGVKTPEAASDLLFIPDMLTYLFTGTRTTEATIASTSQLLSPVSGTWEEELLHAIGIRRSIFRDPIKPGTIVGPMEKSSLGKSARVDLPVVAVASHDTASAVAAVPATGHDWAYISSGTWSLMGIEIMRPILTPEAMKANFTNEGGVDGTIRFLKNIAGLWLLQECRRRWAVEGESISYDQIVDLAASAPRFRSLVDPDWHGFLHPEDMRNAITRYCQHTGQPAPSSPGEFARTIFESLALKYRQVLEELREVHTRPLQTVHIIGGGSRNRYLCQCTANATGLEVLAGPAEATAIGNIMLQARALGVCRSLPEMREVVAKSWTPEQYLPEDRPAWEEAYGRFRSQLVSRTPEIHA